MVAELDSAGAKRKGYVYAGGGVLAEQERGRVAWRHTNPLTGSRGGSSRAGEYWTTGEADPLGANVGTEDPFLSAEGEAGYVPDAVMPRLGEVGCSVANPTCTRCTLDGVGFDCERAFEMLERGAVTFESWATVRVTYRSGRVETYSDRSTLPPGLDIRFRGSEAVLAGAVFGYWNGVRGFGFAVSTAIGAVFASRMPGSEGRANDLFRGFSSSFAPQQSDFNYSGIAFTDDQREELGRSYNRINQDDCKKFINDTLAKHKVGKDFDSLGKLLAKATFSFYDTSTFLGGHDYSPSQLGIDTHGTLLIRGAFLAGASAVTYRTSVFLSSKVFDRPILGYIGRTADTPSYIVHELFHLAGIPKEIVDSQQFTDEIRKNCRLRGSNRIILLH